MSSWSWYETSAMRLNNSIRNTATFSTCTIPVRRLRTARMVVQKLTAPAKELEASRQAALIESARRFTLAGFLFVLVPMQLANQRCNQNLIAFRTRLPGYRLVFN
jgi:hypothetical protein